jgi:hypothetical protein
MRRLPGPADDRLSERGNSRGSLRIVSGLAENTTQSSATALSSLRQQMDVRFCKDAGTLSREAHVRSGRS